MTYARSNIVILPTVFNYNFNMLSLISSSKEHRTALIALLCPHKRQYGVESNQFIRLFADMYGDDSSLHLIDIKCQFEMTTEHTAELICYGLLRSSITGDYNISKVTVFVAEYNATDVTVFSPTQYTAEDVEAIKAALSINITEGFAAAELEAHWLAYL